MDNTLQQCGSAAGMPAIAAIMRAAGVIESRAEEMLGAINLSLAKQAALHHLAAAGEPLSLSDMAQKLTCVRSNMTQLIDRLEADGLARRVDDPSDRRVVRAELTPLGRKLSARGDKVIEAAEKELMGNISADDAASIIRILRAIV